MKTAQSIVTNVGFTVSNLEPVRALSPQVIFAFGSMEFFEDQKLGQKLRSIFPGTRVLGCSTAGEISDKGVSDHSLVVTGVRFERAKFKLAAVRHTGLGHTMGAGEGLSGVLNAPDIKSIFVLAQGVNINGSALIQGLQGKVAKGTVVTGGLAGDGAKFKNTWVMCDDVVAPDLVVGLGLYGSAVQVTFGSVGGWEPIGTPLKVTKAIGNLLLELDGKPALDVYKVLLGSKASELPGSGLLFPFAITDGPKGTPGTIRTLLGVNETNKSLVLAGDIPNGVTLSLMKASTEGLVRGAEGAAKTTMTGQNDKASLSLLVSCVGRKLVMGGSVENEVRATQAVMGKTPITGFYSYGEICPSGFVDNCKLHNQTMTITRITEN